MTMNQPSSRTSAIAQKVLAGEKATPEETKSLAAWVLGQNDEEKQASSETPSIAGRVLAGGKATREEKENLAASALGGDDQRSTWWTYAAVSAAVGLALLVAYFSFP
jgi:hypothetical protein